MIHSCKLYLLNCIQHFRSELKNELIQTIDALTKVKSDKAILARKYEALQEEVKNIINVLSFY